jgi:ubiquinone biosynthesis protein UbiJ
MFSNLQTLAGSAVMERATLLVNHVLSSEPVAMQRLMPHSGRSIALNFVGWPSLLPALPTTRFTVTPAGLVEWCGIDPGLPADLTVNIDASNPALAAVRSLAGERPQIEVQGDAALAADVNWLFDNLRWDIEDDLAKLVGAGAAHQLARLASAVATALRAAVRGASTLAARARGESAGPPRQ